MNAEEKESVKFFQEQAKREEEIVRSLNDALENLKNPVVVSVLKGISLDSAKHADMYKAAENIVSVAPAMSEGELDRLEKVVSWHITNEEKLMTHLDAAIKKTRDPRVKLLLESIMSDEKRHHELLKTIIDTIVRAETISEDEWWDIIWKNVPFHGAPGG
jgi:rubrerythrin